MPVQQTTVRWVVQEDGSKIRAALPPEVVPSEEVAVPEETVAPEEEAVVEEVAPEEPDSYPVPRTHADADEQAAARGLTFPSDDMTVKEKQDFLESH